MDKKRIHEMLECMTKWCEAEFAKGVEHIDTKEMGEAIDMVKDLAEAEKAAWEKCYYEKIVEAMKEEEEMEELMAKLSPEEHERAGYDRWRRSSGRFAPKGHGHETSMAMATGRGGYIPDPDRFPPYYDDPRMWDGVGGPYMMGYDGGSRTGRSDRNSSGRGTDGSSMGPGQQSGSAGRMGYTPNDNRDRRSPRDGRESYDDARRHFHESGTQESRMMMEEKGKEYVDETLATIRDIFAEADPKMQQKVMGDLGRLYREFGGK